MIDPGKILTSHSTSDMEESVTSESEVMLRTIAGLPPFGESPTSKPSASEAGAALMDEGILGEWHVESLVRGRSPAFWKRERLNAAADLLAKWEHAEGKLGTPAFPVSVDGLVDSLDTEMARFRGIQQEDIGSSLFQLVAESLTGEPYERLEKDRLTAPIRHALEVAAKESVLSIATYNECLAQFTDVDLRE